jgi:transposase
MHVIGEETSQRLDAIPAQYQVIVTHRPKYACRACEEVVVQAAGAIGGTCGVAGLMWVRPRADDVIE